MVTLSLPCPPLEVGAGYRSRADVCSGNTGLGCCNNLEDAGSKDSTVCQFTNIVLTASTVASCELHMMVGTSLSAVDKKLMTLFILSYAVLWGCVRYACKYSDVSVIFSDLVLLSISCMQR